MRALRELQILGIPPVDTTSRPKAEKWLKEWGLWSSMDRDAQEKLIDAVLYPDRNPDRNPELAERFEWKV